MDEQPVRRPAYWAVLPAEIRYDPELPDKAKLLYAEISSLTSETGYCWASNEHFCQLYACTERTIRRLISALAARGYIRIQDGNGGSGRRKIFAGINPLAGNPDKIFREHGQNFPGNPDKNVRHSKKESKKEDQNPPKAPKGASVPEYCPEIFERFWALYPIHKSRQSAVKAWDRLKPSGELMRTISKALKRQMATDEQWTRGIGIPYAATYLNQRRWEDDILPDRSAAGTEQGAGSEEVQREWI